ncbi:MAG: hypothetical protein AAFN11_18770 [Chloroflexota bacterium]
MKKRVILIGGAPGAGKTTLGSALAVKLGVNSLTIDDLVTASVAITTPETHQGLHVMRKTHHTDYYTNSSLEQLKADATLRHEATFPMVERLIRKYVKRDAGIVIDGWHIRPQWVAELALDSVVSCWLVVEPSVLEARERKQSAFFEGSANPEKMFENFLGRSLWYNALIEEQASQLGMKILRQTGNKSVYELCEEVIDTLE